MERAIALALMWLYLLLARRIWVERGPASETVGMASLAGGVVAARGAFVIANLPAFMAEPLSVFAIGQGGFLLWPGAFAAMIVAVAMLRRQTASLWMVLLILSIAAVGDVAGGLVRGAPARLPHGITLERLDGRMVQLDRLRGRPFVVNLWATWCPPCRREMPMIADVAAKANMPVLMVDSGEDVDVVRSYLASQRLSAQHVLLDQGDAVQKVTKIMALPTTLFISADGRIQSTYNGEISRAALIAGMRDLER